VWRADDALSMPAKWASNQGRCPRRWVWDEDTDDDIRGDVEDVCGGELLDEDIAKLSTSYCGWRDGAANWWT